MDNLWLAVAAGTAAMLLAACMVGPGGRPPTPPTPKPPKPPMPPTPPKPPSPPPPPAPPGGGRAFVLGLPKGETPSQITARDEQILSAITEGFHRPIVWQPVTSTYKGVTATAWVTDDAIAVGTDADWIRVPVRHATAQRIADHFGALLPTTKIVDLAWQQAQTRIDAHQQPFSTTTETSLVYHDAIEAERKGRGGLTRTVGKEFVNANKLKNWPDYMVQYGMHSPTARWTGPGGLKVWQPCALDVTSPPPHNLWHTDYSSMATLVHPTCQIDGIERAIADVLRDPELAPLFSHEGAMTVLRHPAVPEPGGIV